MNAPVSPAEGQRVSLSAAELAGLTVHDSGFRYDGDGALLRLGLQAYAFGIVDAMTWPMRVREDRPPFGGRP